jgi:hypothetical protein
MGIIPSSRWRRASQYLDSHTILLVQKQIRTCVDGAKTSLGCVPVEAASKYKQQGSFPIGAHE